MRIIDLPHRSVAIETVPDAVPAMNSVWYGEAPDYLALITTRHNTLLLPGDVCSLQSLFLWMQTQPGTDAVYLYRDSLLHAEYKTSEQGFVTYHEEKQTIVILDLLQKEALTYYELPKGGQCRPGEWRMVEGLSNICYFIWACNEQKAIS